MDLILRQKKYLFCQLSKQINSSKLAVLLKWNNNKTNWTKSSYIGYRFREVQQYTCSGVCYNVRVCLKMSLLFHSWILTSLCLSLCENHRCKCEFLTCRYRPLGVAYTVTLCCLFQMCWDSTVHSLSYSWIFPSLFNLSVKTDANTASFNRLVWHIVIWCCKYSNNSTVHSFFIY